METVGWIIVLFFIVSLLLALCRELICWWAKINERLKVLYEIRDLLTRLNARQGEKGQGGVIDVDVVECREQRAGRK